MSTSDPTPETMQLLQAVWTALTPPQRKELLDSLGTPPTEDEIRKWSEDDTLHRVLLRQWAWLAGISGSLPKPWEQAHAAMVEEFGEGDSEARRFGVVTVTGETPPLTADKIAEMGPADFSKWLGSWKAPFEGWNVPTPSGLATQLSHAVQRSPSDWVAALPEVLHKLRHPTYIRGLLAGIREAAAAKEPPVLDWPAIIESMVVVVSEPWTVETLTADSWDADRDWSEAQREVLRFLKEAFDRDTELEDEQVERAWTILLTLMQKHPVQQGVSGPDLLTVAINRTSTMALQAMFSLALSISRRGLDLTRWRGRLVDAVGEELAVAGQEAALTRGLVASLFAQFVHVSGPQALDLVPSLFGDSEQDTVSAAVVETLVTFARPITNEMLVLLTPYVLAYLRTDRTEARAEARRDAVRWLVIRYIRRIDGYTHPASLIEVLQLPEDLSEAAEFYGRVLKDTPSPEPGFIEIARDFWDEALRREEIEGRSFAGFGWWAEAATIDDDVWLSHIYPTLERTSGAIDWADEVVRRLVRLPEKPETWKSLALLVRAARDYWSVTMWARDLHALFEATADLPEPSASLRRELAERLIERELLDFRRYLS